jgi:hypothetical protein
MTPIETLLLDWQPGHSDLQMDSFITLRTGGTLYGCLFQSLRELATRWYALRDREFSREQLLVDIDELESVPGAGFEKRRNEIKLRQKRMCLDSIDRTIADTRKEMERFHKQADAFRVALESQDVSFPLDRQTKHRLDCEMWEHNLKARCAVELMANGRLGNSTLELIQSCPREMRSRIAEQIDGRNHERLLSWFMEQDQEFLKCSESFDSSRPCFLTSPMGEPKFPESSLPPDYWSASTARNGMD